MHRSLIALALIPVFGCDCGEELAPIPAAGDVQGLLCDDEGEAYDLEEVRFDVEGESFEGVTKGDGSFRFEGVPVGDGELITEDGRLFEAQIRDGELTVIEDANCDIVIEPPPPPPLETGDLRGRVCAPDGTTWLSAADVSIVAAVDGEDVVFETQTDGEGNFLLEDVPAGDHDLLVVKGSFSSIQPVTVVANVETVLPEEECAIEPDLRIAMIAHSQYERVQDVILELGIDPALVDDYGSDWAGLLLADYATVSQYEVIFLPCRAAEPEFMGNEVYVENLRQWVADGGSLYTSDQGYDFVERLFPEKIDFFGDDLVPGAGDRGAIVSGLQATIVSGDLQAFLTGATSVQLHYALETWSVMESVAGDVEVYVRADAPVIGGATVVGSPQVVGFDHGDGRVLYSSFHQEPGVSADQEAILRFLIFEL
jgi:hypothetical protein